jgi:hypothetical protein
MAVKEELPSDFFIFCSKLRGYKAFNKNGFRVFNYELFHAYKFRTVKQVERKFKLKQIDKNGIIG